MTCNEGRNIEEEDGEGKQMVGIAWVALSDSTTDWSRGRRIQGKTRCENVIQEQEDQKTACLRANNGKTSDCSTTCEGPS